MPEPPAAAGGVSRQACPGHYPPPGGYTPAVPAEQIATNLALINWTVLAALAVGTFAVVVLARLATPATKGYLAFTAFSAAGFGFLAYLSDTGLPSIAAASPVSADPAFDVPRRAALALFTVLALVTTIVRGGRANAPVLPGSPRPACGGVMRSGALTWGGGPLGAVPLAIQLLVLAAATGGVFAAMILGHWYLVTPKLPEAPLVLVSRRLLWIVALQVVLFVGWVGLRGGPRQGSPVRPGADRSGRWSAPGRCSCGSGSSSASCSR